MAHSPFIPNFVLVLASQSPRRSELLRQAGIPFTIRPANIPEMIRAGESARDYVARLASAKAAAISAGDGEGILAADTTVAVQVGGAEKILEKPRDAEEARSMLYRLAGRSHSVYTGICFCWLEKEWVHVEQTTVEFTSMTDQEVAAYVDSGEPFDKAGAYGIQGLASKFISRVDGCFFNVVGLPIHQVYKMLWSAGVLARAETPETAF